MRAEKRFLTQCDNLALWSLMGEEGDILSYHRSDDGFLNILGKGVIYHPARALWKAIVSPGKRMEW